MPYLNISYRLQKTGSEQVLEGDFHAMVANDGPHYGDNLKLMGPGKYQLTYFVSAPGQQAHGEHFGRHTDKETGVVSQREVTAFSRVMGSPSASNRAHFTVSGRRPLPP